MDEWQQLVSQLTEENASIRRDFVDALEHGILVSNLTRMVSRELHESEEMIQMLTLAGLVHDIGKLKLTGHLYGKIDGGMAVEEMKYVRMHSTYSGEILMEKKFDPKLVSMVYHHHENYDGTGYPDNLKENEIPWGARIIRVCDVFAALISKRPYRDAFSFEQAIELMIEEAKNFDVIVFLAFMRAVHSEDFDRIREMVRLEKDQGHFFPVEYAMRLA